MLRKGSVRKTDRMANSGNHCNTQDTQKEMDESRDHDERLAASAGNPGNQVETFHFSSDITFEQM